MLAGAQPQAAWLDDAHAMAAVAAGDQHALRHRYERYGCLVPSLVSPRLRVLVTDEATITG